MNVFLLTQNSTPIFKYIVWILGKIMEGIFTVIDAIGIPNIGLAIILFTIVVNLLMLPLTIKQQKFSKLSAKMSPELNAIRDKYKGKTDQNSQIAMNNDMQAVYAKYGVSPTGGCGYMLIQMPILFALYRVIYAMPTYVGKIGDTFRVLADKIIATYNGAWLMESGSESIASTVSMYGQSMTKGDLQNGIVDVLNRLSSTDIATVAEQYGLSGLRFEDELILGQEGLINTYNNFLGLNVGDSPWHIMQDAFSQGEWLLVLGALAIPLLSALTQWINTKLIPQQNTDDKNMDETATQMQSTMKTMNTIMPLMSAYFCFSLPAGMGIYWVAGSVVRSIQQVVINKHIDSLDFDVIMKQNAEKSAKKMAKLKENQEKLNAYANMNTRNIQSIQQKANVSTDSQTSTSNRTAKPGSMLEKANMVNNYNKNNK